VGAEDADEGVRVVRGETAGPGDREAAVRQRRDRRLELVVDGPRVDDEFAANSRAVGVEYLRADVRPRAVGLATAAEVGPDRDETAPGEARGRRVHLEANAVVDDDLVTARRAVGVEGAAADVDVAGAEIVRP